MTEAARPQAKEGVLRVTPYAGSEAKPGGGQLINISSNESAFGASARAVEAYTKAASDLRRYPEIDARSLRQALAAHYGLEAERIICGNGSDQIIDLLALAYAGVGDEVVYSAHGFQMYPIAAHAVGAMPVAAPEVNLTTDVDALLDKVGERTRILFLANPNNPTGTFVTRSELARLHAGLPGNVVLVIDAAYAEFVTHADYEPGIELARAHDNVVMTRTFSKIFALASLRVGWAYGPREIIDILDRIRPPFNVNAPAIDGAIAALADHEHTETARRHNGEVLPWFTGEVEALGLTVNPSVANFVIVHFDPDTPKNAEAAYQHLFDNGIVTRRVGGYGLPDWVRMSIGTREEMTIVRDALKEFLEKND
ncbi:MAG: histidinol-phosphate transaminase [Alphaproteobacteria bacterium]|nr:histidinol-phosphate transaminase [Alphaproteobacteria bacterium]